MNIFKRKKEKQNMKLDIKRTGDIEYDFIYANDYINIVHDACSICYGRNTERTYDERRDYIRRRSNHESIMEHSNVIINYTIDEALVTEALDVLEYAKYLTYRIKNVEGKVFILVAGSIRGYKEVIRNIKNTDNKFYRAFLNSMYYIDECFMKDFIEDEIMNFYDFKTVIETENHFDKIKLKRSSIINIDDIKLVYSRIMSLALPFELEDLLNMCTTTIKFEEVSRVITQQLTRHRAGITQASQRYINYSNAKFFSPDMFKPDKYEKDKKYEISFMDTKVEATLQELGQAIISIYPQLVEQGLLKEDARAFLPNNTESSLYMTFTLWGLIKFLELRTDKHAQKEIQLIALEIEEVIKKQLGNNIYDYLLPKYKRIPEEMKSIYDKVDEVIEE